MTNGADILCDTLLANGVDVCFANPGTSEMHFVAALDRKPQMRCVLGLFEGVATGAADGYARMADRPAVTLLHLGPGLANGLANLHNARRARTPIINVVGDHATYHLFHDAPLTSDIASLARPMSLWVGSAQGPDSVMKDANAAYAAAVGGRGVATLVLPADAAWGEAPDGPIQTATVPAPEPVSQDVAKHVAHAIETGKRVVVLLGGRALRAEAMETAFRLAALPGVRVLAQASNPRMARGRGRPVIERVPFRVEAALETLAGTDMLVLVGSVEPVAFFAYPGKPSRLVPDGCDVVALARPDQDSRSALDLLVDLTGAPPYATGPDAAQAPEPPHGPLTGASVAATIARLLPDNAVVVDESITSAPEFYGLSHGSAPHDYLALTGGSIGIGIPMAVGAGVACPDRKIVALQADGSGMYTVQALWTQARERLDVVTVILSNRTYNILLHEMANVGVADPGRNARRMLNLDDPDLDWVALARGCGVPGERADTVERFADLFARAVAGTGPFLIQADL